jgi:hypothetical protein
MAKYPVLALVSIILGFIVTWATGQFLAPFAVIQIDIVQYGAPLPWMRRVIPTQFTNYLTSNLVVDAAFWSIIVFVIAWLITGRSQSKK